MTVAAITGVGVISPLGNGAEPLIEGWKAGRSGIVDGRGECRDFDPSSLLTRKEIRRADRVSQMTLVAGEEALAQAGWLEDLPYDPDRVGTVIGTGIGGFNTLASANASLAERGVVPPLAIPMLMPNAPAGLLALRHGYGGPSYGTVSACAAGAHAISAGIRELGSGSVDAIVVGGTEAALVPLAQKAFEAMEATSPTGQSRPFHADRDGFVFGEGAAILVLEHPEAARDRGANILGYVRGVGASQDAYHLTAPSPTGAGAAKAVTVALADAGITVDHVDYINAHGTGTPLNDSAETGAMHLAFGERILEIPISSLKGNTGHSLGAAGAIEAVATTLALRDRVAPATCGLDKPDPELKLKHVIGEPLALPELDRAPIAVSTSFGFGGHNACIVLEGAEKK